MQKIILNKEPVELFKLLKFEGIAQSGGEAKKMIEAELVSVNGNIETRKRKKINSGDLIKIGGDEFIAELESSQAEEQN